MCRHYSCEDVRSSGPCVPQQAGVCSEELESVSGGIAEVVLALDMIRGRVGGTETVVPDKLGA